MRPKFDRLIYVRGLMWSSKVYLALARRNWNMKEKPRCLGVLIAKIPCVIELCYALEIVDRCCRVLGTSVVLLLSSHVTFIRQSIIYSLNHSVEFNS